MYCYGNNGHSMKQVKDNYSVQAGEILFAHIATEIELVTAFPSYAEEFKAQKLAALQADYNNYIAKLGQDYAIAMAQGNTDVAVDIRSEMTTVLEQYAADKATLTE
jgi:hypothetical protein